MRTVTVTWRCIKCERVFDREHRVPDRMPIACEADRSYLTCSCGCGEPLQLLTLRCPLCRSEVEQIAATERVGA